MTLLCTPRALSSALCLSAHLRHPINHCYATVCPIILLNYLFCYSFIYSINPHRTNSSNPEALKQWCSLPKPSPRSSLSIKDGRIPRFLILKKNNLNTYCLYKGISSSLQTQALPTFQGSTKSLQLPWIPP